MTEPTACPRCDGNGVKEDLLPCSTCQGEGVVTEPDEYTCTNCHGRGWIPWYSPAMEVRCNDCSGTGRYPEGGAA